LTFGTSPSSIAAWFMEHCLEYQILKLSLKGDMWLETSQPPVDSVAFGVMVLYCLLRKHPTVQ